MKKLNVRGAYVWFMTFISTVDDVFDAFNRDAEFVLAPYHFVDSSDEWRDICDVSDSVIPTIFVHNGMAITPGGKRCDVFKVLDTLVSIGFYKNCVLDTDGSLDEPTWDALASDYPSTIPFVDKELKGFQTTIRISLV